uniref:uncharacterized protein LOC122602890 n=1 Tax=Erigeron canadensis TaxID=72917 RepID=UPI001CB8C17C|nr:uncharacterized protein LOC122602890 [Erigeron canadensis]XP_043631436.1 uncharacterized protein LOC122602890 [Erigeron canadensis]
MEALKNIWPEVVDDATCCCSLRYIEVWSCDNLVNVFPRNPMPLLPHLERIEVYGCGSIQALFDIDVGEKGGGISKLRSIYVYNSERLTEVWRLKRGGAAVHINHPDNDDDDVIICGCFQAVEEIEIKLCPSFRNIFTPTTARFDMGALKKIYINGNESIKENDESVGRNQEEIDDTSKREIIEVVDNIPYVAYPFHLLPTFHHLQSLYLKNLIKVEVVFDIENATSRDLTIWDNQQPPILSYLKDLKLVNLEKMNCVWKCTSWNQFLYSQKQGESPFQNLTTIFLKRCGKIKYLFSPLMAKLLFNLNTIDISDCDGIEEVVSNADDDDDDIQTMAAASTSSHTNPTFFPHLDSLSLYRLSKLKFISNFSIHENVKSSEVDVVSWSLCQYPRKINISECNALPIVIPFNVVGKLQKLQELKISRCNLLGHVFTSSTLESLKQLEELTIEDCKAMQVIVKKDGKHTTSKVVIFPQLKSLTLTDLPNVEGFFMGMNEFQWPQLDKVKISGCPQMMVFTSGHSTTPKLNSMHTRLGRHSLECGFNFEFTNASNEAKFHNSSMCSTPDMIKLLQYPWSFSNLVEVDTKSYSESSKSRIFFPQNELHKLQNLEKLNITAPEYQYDRIVEEVFEVGEETNDYMNEAQSVVVFPKLKEVTLEWLKSVKHIWKSNQRIVLNFPKLTKVFIDNCPLLGNVFTSCMIGSLLQLQELHISQCENMEVIAKQVEEDFDTRAKKVVVFPFLKSVTLLSLENLKGFYLGLEAFKWPSLDTLEIKDCPQITVFTRGQSTTPKLKVIDTTFGLCYATEDPTSFIKTKQQEGWQF